MVWFRSAVFCQEIRGGPGVERDGAHRHSCQARQTRMILAPLPALDTFRDLRSTMEKHEHAVGRADADQTRDHVAHHDHAASGTATGTRDLVCGMTVDPAKTPHKLVYDGETYYFCSAGCLQKFRADPAKYLAAASSSAGPALVQLAPLAAPTRGTTDAGRSAPTDRMYTCPMHPEVRQIGPGSCPKCGMALEPAEITAEEDDTELRDMRRRLWVSLALTVPVFVIAMAEMLPGEPLARLLPPRVSAWVQFALATPVVLWGGWPFFVRGWTSIVARQLNMFTLIAIGVGTAYAESVVATVAPGIFPESFRSHTGQVATYFESATVIVTLVLFGQVLELRARSQTSQRHSQSLATGAAARPGACLTMAASTTCPWKRSNPEIGCACGPARRCRSTALSSMAPVPSTSR